MPRTVAEVESDIATLKAEGKHPMSAEVRALRDELKALAAPPPPRPPTSIATAAAGDDGDAPVTPRKAPPVSASDDVAFVNEALTQLLLKNKTGKVEQAYSDVRSLLRVKHILEDAAGLVPVGRISLPHWDTLGRERDTGEKFKPGENQAVVDGTAQRAVPVNPRTAAASKPSITTRDGQPITLSRSRALDEPEGNAAFVSVSGDAE